MPLLKTFSENISDLITGRSKRLKRDALDENKRQKDDDSSCRPRKKSRSESDACVCFEHSSRIDSDGKMIDISSGQMGGTDKRDTLVLREKPPDDDGMPKKKWMEHMKQDSTTKEKPGDEIECETNNISFLTSCGLQVLIYPNPEFCNFDKFRDVSQFSVDQIWAVYDDADGMPRRYAWIRKVDAPDLELHVTLLEPITIFQTDTPKAEAELPIACGNFKLGKLEIIEDLLMFSHIMLWERGLRESTYDIHPIKGEVWAIFKSKGIGSSSSSDNDKLYQYDVVEVLSDFTMGAGLTIIPLVRIKGFVSLFTRSKEKLNSTDVIPLDGTHSFSHKIPSYKLIGTEIENIPEGTFELDILSLPSNYKKAFPSICLRSCRTRAAACLKDAHDREAAGTCAFQNTSTGRSHHLSPSAMDAVSEVVINQSSESQYKEAHQHAMCQADQTDGTRVLGSCLKETPSKEAARTCITHNMSPLKSRDSFPVVPSDVLELVRYQTSKGKLEVPCEDAIEKTNQANETTIIVVNSNDVHEEAPETCITQSTTRRTQHVPPNEPSVVDEMETEYTTGSQHEETCKHPPEEANQADLVIGGKSEIHMEDISEKNSEESDNNITSHAPSSRCTAFGDQELKFHDFGEERSIKNFQSGQIWAAYCKIDKLPRCYVLINDVYKESQKVCMTRLEPCPAQEEETPLVKEDMHIGCGTFSLTSTSTIDNICTFSHILNPSPTDKSPYVILPSTGEIWAIYERWGVEWSCLDLANCVYNIVEICETTTSGIKARLLEKVDGCRTVFKLKKDGTAMTTLEIPVNEYIRFSHQIPAFQLTDEIQGELCGCWELDFASVPKHFLYDEPPELETEEKEHLDTGGANNEDSADSSILSAPYIRKCPLQYPGSEFHDFDEARTINNFRDGQVWALYSEIDTYPKYYAMVKKVDIKKGRLHMSWLESCPTQGAETKWMEEDMPISCGTFEVIHENMIIQDIDTFSHPMQAKPIGRVDQYLILPNSGDIWAIYKNWNPDWSLSDLENAELDVVEIGEATEFGIKVSQLTKVDGYRAVYKTESKEEGSLSEIEIPDKEYVRFSHQIPAFKLTDERGGELRGYWELDAASVP